MMLCRENPAAQMIRPSKGDGGIDVQVPTDDGTGRFDVYQVKKFASNLTTSQKSQIVSSLDRMQQTVESGRIVVRDWFATMPLNPTNPNLDWLAEKGKGRPFTVSWRGLNFMEGLVAKYPDVIDYYLKDNKERLAAEVAAFTTLLGFGQHGTVPAQPAELTSTALAMQQVVDHDPHFSYAISTLPAGVPAVRNPAAVFTRTMSDARGTVSVDVIPRFAEALTLRPISGRFTVTAKPGTVAHQEWLRFRKYGGTFTATDGAAALLLDLPGGLGIDTTGGDLTIKSTADGLGQKRRLRLLSDDGTALATTPVTMTDGSRGLGGLRTVWTSDGGLFALQLTLDLDTNAGSLQLETHGLEGTDPEGALADLRFLKHFTSAGRLGFALPKGPFPDASLPLNAHEDGQSDFDTVPFDDIIAVAEGLVAIQEHVTDVLTMPAADANFTYLKNHVAYVRTLLDGDVYEGAHPHEATFEKGSGLPRTTRSKWWPASH